MIADDALADLVRALIPLPAVVDLERLSAVIGGSCTTRARKRRRSCSARAEATTGGAGARRPRDPAPLSLRSRRFDADRDPRQIVAYWDAGPTISLSGTTHAAPFFSARRARGNLGLSDRQWRVIAPFVVGGFGPQDLLFESGGVVLPGARASTSESNE